jgi:hypothetical protein
MGLSPARTKVKLDCTNPLKEAKVSSGFLWQGKVKTERRVQQERELPVAVIMVHGNCHSVLTGT